MMKKLSVSRARRLAAVAVAGLATLALAACSSGGGGGNADSGGSVTLTVMNQSRGQEKALNELAAKYAKANGITIKVDSPGPADYLTKLQAAAQSRKMPDLFSAVGGTDMAPFYRAGLAENLQPELAGEWGKNFIPAVLQLTTFKKGNPLGIPAGIYSAHYDYAPQALFVNPANVKFDPKSPPATFEQFVDDLGSGGVDGKGKFSVAASVTPQFVQTFASNYMTDEQIEATFSGKASWKTDAWAKTFKAFVDLADANAVASGSLPGGTDDNPQVEKSFFNTRDVGVIFDSTVAVPVARTTAPDFTAYSAITIPAPADATQTPRSQVSTGKGFAMSSSTPHRKEALAFLKWLTEPTQQQYFVDKVGTIPTNPQLLANGGLAPQIASLGDAIDKFQIVQTPMTTDVRDVVARGTQSLVLGKTTVDALLNDIQKAQDLSK